MLRCDDEGAHYDFYIFLGTAQNEVERTTVFQSTLLAPRRRCHLQIISRNAQTTSQKEEEGGGGVVRPSPDVRCKNAEKYDDATTREGKRIVTPAQSPRTVSSR